MTGMRSPRKVLDLALERGAEPACVGAGPGGACQQCHGIMMDAFDHFYGDVPHDRLVTTIAAELVAGQ